MPVDREKTNRRAVFRGHIADRGTVSDRQAGCARAAELDKFAHHLFAAQHLGDREDQIGGGDPAAQLAFELNADHVGGQQIDRLSKHAGLGFDASHPPAQHTDSIDHGGVAVGADQCIGVVDVVARVMVYTTRQVFEVDLVDNAKAGGHDAKRVECLHSPLHELVTFLVALKFELHVQVERPGCAEVVDHDRMVNDQVDWHEWLDALRILALAHRDVAHGRQIRQQWNASEVLQHDP